MTEVPPEFENMDISRDYFSFIKDDFLLSFFLFKLTEGLSKSLSVIELYFLLILITF